MSSTNKCYYIKNHCQVGIPYEAMANKKQRIILQATHQRTATNHLKSLSYLSEFYRIIIIPYLLFVQKYPLPW